MIKIIVALDKNNLIGKNNSLPWSNKEDSDYFKETIKDKVIVIGKNTYENLPMKLKAKQIYVLSDKEYDGVISVGETETLIKEFKGRENDLWVCGGSKIYSYFVDIADELYISLISGDFKGDTYFPQYLNKFKLEETKRMETFTLNIYKKK